MTDERRKAGNEDCSTVQAANMEPDPGNAPLGSEEIEGLDPQSRVRIHIHSRRKRLCDPDGISGKAVIDGFVHAGILADDSPKHVKEVSFSQEKTTGKEETIIEIWQ